MYRRLGLMATASSGKNYKNDRPPNILIFTKGNPEEFNKWKHHFQNFVEPDRFAIYQLEPSLSSKAWIPSTRLLIITSNTETLTESSSDFCGVHHLKDYLMNGGDCLSLFQTIAPDWLATEDFQLQLKAGVEELFVKHVLSPSGGILVAPSYNVDETSILSLLPHVLEECFHIHCRNESAAAAALISQGEHSNSLSATGHLVAEPFHEESFFRKATSWLSIHKIDSQQTTFQLFNEDLKNKTEHLAITRIQSQLQQHRFNQLEYFKVLETKLLGRTCLYFDVISSTHSVLDRCPSSLMPNGSAIFARRQTHGRGRSGNVWISPDGCAMFSLRLEFSLQSQLGRHLSLLQHVTALAIVLAIKNIPECLNIELGVKWPNDIYHYSNESNTRTKVGGILVTTSITGTMVSAAIGCGVNLSNAKPTVSINELIEMQRSLAKHPSAPLTLEHYLAAVFNQLELLIDLISAGKIQHVIDLYHQHWLHSGAEVRVQLNEGSENREVPARIIGIDEYGFLRVSLISGTSADDECRTVHPDGNSFDMFHGLLVPKF